MLCSSHDKTANTWQNEWGHKCIFSHGETNARGVAILLNKTINKILEI